MGLRAWPPWEARSASGSPGRPPPGPGPRKPGAEPELHVHHSCRHADQPDALRHDRDGEYAQCSNLEVAVAGRRATDGRPAWTGLAEMLSAWMQGLIGGRRPGGLATGRARAGLHHHRDGHRRDGGNLRDGLPAGYDPDRVSGPFWNARATAPPRRGAVCAEQVGQGLRRGSQQPKRVLRGPSVIQRIPITSIRGENRIVICLPSLSLSRQRPCEAEDRRSLRRESPGRRSGPHRCP